jgi:hypothetical protein
MAIFILIGGNISHDLKICKLLEGGKVAYFFNRDKLAQSMKNYWGICAGFFVLAGGCATVPDFEATVVDGTAYHDKMPEEWKKSLEPTPYFSQESASGGGGRGGEGGDGKVKDGGVSLSAGGRGATVLKVNQPPYGTPVPGKPQLVRSPFTDQGFVDVSGHPPETEVRCPYSGQIFLVP